MAFEDQLSICDRFGVSPDWALPDERIGISQNIRSGVWPLNGLRVPRDKGTSGWFVWRGGEMPSDEPTFFRPIHISHLGSWCAELEQYLALPVGYRILLAPEVVDVWFDATLLR